MRDAYCLRCGGMTGMPCKKGANLAEYRCARIASNSIFSCLGKLSGNKMLCPPDQGLVHPKGGPYILVLTTASTSALRAAQREWTVPVGRCAP